MSTAEGMLMATAYGGPRLLTRNGLSLQDFDYCEIREAFASTVLATLAAWPSQRFCRDPEQGKTRGHSSRGAWPGLRASLTNGCSCSSSQIEEVPAYQRAFFITTGMSR
jgi:hypothetical protein